MATKVKLQIIFTLCGCFCLVGCAPSLEPIHVRLESVTFSGSERSSMPSHTQRSVIPLELNLVDARFDKEHLGRTDVVIYGSGVKQWTYQGIQHLSTSTALISKENGSKPQRSLEFVIKRLSCRGTVMHLRCTFVADVTFIENDERLGTKTYFGSGLVDKSLLSYGTRHFGEKAILSGLKLALEEVVKKLDIDVKIYWGAGSD